MVQSKKIQLSSTAACTVTLCLQVVCICMLPDHSPKIVLNIISAWNYFLWGRQSEAMVLKKNTTGTILKLMFMFKILTQ